MGVRVRERERRQARGGGRACLHPSGLGARRRGIGRGLPRAYVTRRDAEAGTRVTQKVIHANCARTTTTYINSI
jgi:hypothetical protein